MEAFLYEQQSKGHFELSADAFNLHLNNSNFYELKFTKKQQETIEQLIWAIQNRRKITINSISPHVDSNFNFIANGDVLLPLSLQYHRGSLHLCSYSETKNKILIIAFDTLADFNPTNETFNPKKYAPLLKQFFESHFGVTPNINGKIYTIELEFAGATGGFVQNFFWHNTQKTKQLKNGNYLLQLRCGINRELVGWIFQWMNNVKVRKPALLQNMVAELYKECAAINTLEYTLSYKNHFVRK